MNIWETDFQLMSELKTYDIGIVLTGVTKDIPPRDRVHYGKGADRVLHTIQLYKLGKIRSILISGGSGLLRNKNKDIESLNIKKTMLMAGVPDSAISIEAKSQNTYENALYSNELLKNNKTKSLLLITSAFHIRRAEACFRKQGLSVACFSTDFYGEERNFYPNAFLPSIDALQAWHIIIREWIGMATYKFAGYI